MADAAFAASGPPLDARPRPIGDLLSEAAKAFPHRPAIDFLGKRTSYRALSRVTARAARGLQDFGLVPGGRVALCLPNTPYYLILYFAVLQAGGVVVNVNPLYVERELAHLLRDSGAEIVVTCDIPDIHARVAKVAAASEVRHVITCAIADALPAVKRFAYRLLKRREIARPSSAPGHLRFGDLIRSRKPPEPVNVSPDDVAVLQYTGGTTGTPKAAMLTHANLVSNADATAQHFGAEATRRERVLGVIPLFHVFAMTTVLNFSVRIGAAMILLPCFDLRQLLATIRRARPTYFPAVPTIYGAIAGASRVDLSSIRVCISGGAPPPAELAERFERVTGTRVIKGYGLSEASPIITCGPVDGTGVRGSAGVPYPGTTIEIRDRDDPRRLLPCGEDGEICARGPQIMMGYWREAGATADTFIDGALRTGDVGRLDASGRLFIVDRIKDLILCGGYNVYPRVIEDALYEHPAVAEAVVIGVPDAYRGQAPKAFGTLSAPGAITPTELRDSLRGKVSKIELPRDVEIRATLPKTLIGKLSKKELIEEERVKAAGLLDRR